MQVENQEMDIPGMGLGIYAKKVFHIDRRFPSWLRMIAPKSGSALHEESKNCFPKTQTHLTLQMFNKFNIHVRTIHAEDRSASTKSLPHFPDIFHRANISATAPDQCEGR